MNLKKTLSKDSILYKLKAETKAEAIKEMVQTLATRGLIKDAATALSAILDREAKMSTGMQNGIAIPHGKSDCVDNLITLVALKPEGIDFDSIDEQPATIFIMTLSPANRAGPHIQFLAEISKLLNREDLRQALLDAPSAEAVLSLLTA